MALKLIQGKQINVNLTGSFTGSFTGNLIGSASFSTSSSFANNSTSASYSISSSYALSSSFTSNSTSASYSISSSYALSSSFASNSTSASYSVTSSFANTATSASYALSSSFAVSSSRAVSSSFSITAVTANSATSASFATNAINAQNAATASNILGGKAPHIPFFITDTTLATSSLYQSGSNTVIINQDAATTANPEALYVWQPSTTSFNVISGKGNLNNYLQLNIQNTNQGTNASSDVVATADNGNENTNYIDMGINGENYNSGFIGAANDAYLYSTGNDLHIGNASNKSVQIFAGGSDVDIHNKLELRPDNQHSMSGSLDVSGSIKAFSFTGSLQGNATSATTSQTSSYSTTLGASLSQPANNQVRLLNSAGGTLSTAIVNNVTSASHADNASTADYAITAGNGGVTQITAGSGVTLIPSNGLGNVTVIATGTGGVTIISGSLVTGSFINTTSFTFNHNLSTRTPIITVFDSNYNQIIPENIQLVNSSSAIITFPTPESGFAIGSTGGTTGTALSSSYALLADYANTASFYAETDPVFVAKSGSFATTGSNVFRGTQTITGSNGRLIYTGTTPGIYPTLAEVHINDDYPWLHRFYNDTFSTSSAVMAYFGYNDGRFVFHNESTQSIGLQVNGFNAENGLLVYSDKVAFVNNVEVTGSLNVVGGITGSLLGTASYATNSDLLDGRDSTVFATTGSNIFRGTQTITGSLTVVNGVTSSLFGTASWAQNSLTSSTSLTSSFVTASNVYGPFGANSVISSSYSTFAQTSSYAINMIVSGGLMSASYIDFNLNPGVADAVGRLKFDSGEGTLQLGLIGSNVTCNIGEDLFQYVYNNTGTILNKGQVVYISGSQGNRIAVKLASATAEQGSANTLGFVAETIAIGAEGWVQTEGTLRKLNTTGLIGGQLLYLSSSAGQYTQTPPVAPNHGVRLGYAERIDNTVGSIYIKIDNGYELGELHDIVDNTTTSSFGDLLVKSGSVWTNSKQLTGSYSITGSLTVSGSSTFTNIGPAIFVGNQTVTGSLFTSGSNTLIGSTTLTGSLNVSGSTTQTGNNTLIGTTTLSGSINVSGSQNFIGSSSFFGNHLLSGSNTIRGNTFMFGNIQVSGSSNFNNSEFIVTGSTSILGNFNVKGTSTFSDTTFTVTGSQYFTGSSFINGNQNLTGNSTVTGSLNVIGNINVISGSSFTRWGNKLFNYAQFANTSSVLLTQNVSASIDLPLTYFSDGVSITSGSRITFANTGLYNVQYSALALQGNTTPSLRIWFRKTGSNVDNSSTIIQLQNNSQTAVTSQFAQTINAGEYIEIWYHSNGANTSFPYTAAASGFPAAPSITVTVTQIA